MAAEEAAPADSSPRCEWSGGLVAWGNGGLSCKGTQDGPNVAVHRVHGVALCGYHSPYDNTPQNAERFPLAPAPAAPVEEAPQEAQEDAPAHGLPVVTVDEVLALLEPVPAPSRATHRDRVERPQYITANGYVITAGLPVEDYDRRTDGVIGRRQFERGGMCDPGGQYWDGWFEVEYPGGSVRKFNGERMRALIQH
jgi:hypothetical protein